MQLKEIIIICELHLLVNFVLICLGLSSFYSELMKGIGASGRLWQLIDRDPTIPLSGEMFITNLQIIDFALNDMLYYCVS